jgi:hypothetical protein
MIRETAQRVKPHMAKPSPIRKLAWAAFCAVLVFASVFLLTYFAHKSNGGFGINLVPAWLEALAAATVCSISAGALVAFFTCYSKDSESRIQEMLNRK